MSDRTLPSEYLDKGDAPKDNAPSLPDIEDAFALVEQDLPEPPQLVEGILHQGSKLVLGGSSKANKTWCLLDLALSVAFGEPWLSCKTSKGRVLYVNLEIQAPFFRKRIDAVARGKGIKLKQGQLDIWNLRGHGAPHGLFFPQISKLAQGRKYVLIVVDPIYKVYGGLRENDAGDVAKMLDALEKLAVETGAAVAFGAHFSKGNQAAKESIDRISGSGVFARDADSIFVMTAHEQEGCFTVDATLRNFRPLDPFVIRWDFPLMRRDDSLDPRQLRQAKGGRKTMYSCEQLLGVLLPEGMTTKAWQKRACDETGMSRSKFFDLKRELERGGRVRAADGRSFPVVSPESPETD